MPLEAVSYFFQICTGVFFSLSLFCQTPFWSPNRSLTANFGLLDATPMVMNFLGESSLWGLSVIFGTFWGLLS